MMVRVFWFIMFMLAPLSTQAATDCKALFNVAAVDVHKLPSDKVYECLQQGVDPNFHFRKASGFGETSTTTSASTQSTGGCRADGVCQNSAIERTTEFVSGVTPSDNPNFKLPEVPWQDITKSNLPCGAVGGLAEMAVQALWGNVKVQMPSEMKSLLNELVSGFLNALFGGSKKIDCQDGSFWGTLNNMISVIFPKLKAGDKSFGYDLNNNTFLAPPKTMLALPSGSNIQIDLSLGAANFHLPAGGSFKDINGNKITIAADSRVLFGKDGNVTLSDGRTFKVQPGGVITLNPEGVVSVPTGATVPVPPNTAVFPMGPITVKPPWVK